MISDYLKKYLDDLAPRIDLAQEQKHYNHWVAFWEENLKDELFCPPTRTPASTLIEWPDININDAMESPELMVLSEFKMVSDVLANGGANQLNVRCNYGTGILSSLFGCDIFVMDRKHNTLPTAMPLGSKEKIDSILEDGVRPLGLGLGAKIWQTAELFLEVFEEYPIFRETIDFYHPDLQGPIDNLEVIVGSELFLEFYDAPDRVKSLLEIVTDTYIAFLDKWFKLAPPRNKEFTAHWGSLIKGKVMLRNDSLMNLSPDIYVEFIRPMDQKIFDKFGGGCVHFCGKGDHYIEAMSQTDGLYSINLSQPEYNDMEQIFRSTIDNGIKIIGYPSKADAPKYLEDMLKTKRKNLGNICGF